MRAWILLAALCVAGCDQANDFNRYEFDGVKDRVDKLQGEVAILRVRLAEQNGGGLMDPSDKGYSLVLSDIGELAFSLQNVAPYANGSRIKLRVGNPHAVTLTDFSIDLAWGEMKGDAPDMEAAKTKTYKFKAPIREGAWTDETIDLAAVPPAKLGFVKVRSPRSDGIRLSPPPS